MADSPIYGDADRSLHGAGPDRHMPEFGGLLGDIGHFVSNAAKTAGKEIGHVGKSIQKAGGAIDHAISKVPVVGAPLHTVLGAAYHAVTLPVDTVVQTAINGKRLDKVLLDKIKQQGRDIKAVAPYAKTVVSMVPGVGTGVSAALGAGMALAEGQPIDKALLDGVISAVPGGPMAKAAASAAASGLSAAVRGEKLDVASVSGKLLAGLPIPPSAKNALATGIHMTADIAAGKNVSAAAADALIKEGLAHLPADAKKAFQTGLATQVGAVLQSAKAAHLPAVHGKLIESGIQLAKTLPAVGEARKLAGAGVKGFDLGHGLLGQRATPFAIIHTRNSITDPHDKLGFDMAMANRIGLVAHPPHPKLTPSAVAGRSITHGMQGMTRPEHKMAIMKAITKSPSAEVGAKVAMNHIAAERKPWPVRVVIAIKKILHV
jgi:hypothetical protein